MFALVYILLCQRVTLIDSQQHVIITPDESHLLDAEPLIINILILNVDICQQINTNDCKSLMHQMLKCQQIIFNDLGFNYQQYKGNIDVHKKILAQYQSMCQGTQNDDLDTGLFDLKKKTNPLLTE
jgi:hypothetical protein